MTVHPPADRPASTTSAQWRSESRSASRMSHDPNFEWHGSGYRAPEFKDEFSKTDHANAVNETLHASVEAVDKTTELIKRKKETMRMERRQFQTEMEVTGRMSIADGDEWLNARLKSVSHDDLKNELDHLKRDQQRNAVTDTLAALVYDVNATAEVLRRGSLGRDKDKKKKIVGEEIEYKLRLTPGPDDEPFPPARAHGPPVDDNVTVDQMSHDYGVEISESQTNSMRRRRAHSETPRRTLNIEGQHPDRPTLICAYCDEEIDGPVLTALAPNSERAQKFHTYHFMCTYCQKALNMHGTYREHDKKPYCHDCFYRLYNGLLYSPDEHQAGIEKLI
ncbi:hypothetical protein PFISCL1PPCAC_18554 [Pristionchus fissidentatus]|uniref:LIM zinc-binding domain-containing protein n=1 Tax=Pristionchus fissidentatus TaxID=1538716 RepID=A0AAV5W8D5_9BILA|nr:hypothetical protein PFISCL1PPCAC_18554 [Pristionchus fissidentatus]